MADGERIRESLQAPLDPTYLKQREQAGWKLVAVEWERAAAAPAVPAPPAEPAPSWKMRHSGCASPGIANTWSRILPRCNSCFR
jgi:hypothetical protein